MQNVKLQFNKIKFLLKPYRHR